MPKKIFELAKEFGIGAIDLVEELRNKGFAVRNHMAVLSDEDLEKIMEMRKKDAEEKEQQKAAKKKTVRKKAAKKTTKKATKKKTTKVTSVKSETATTAKKTKKTTKAKKKTVIRRKSSDAASKSEEQESDVTVTAEQALAKDVVDEAKKAEDDKNAGLRIVSRPEEEAEDATPDATTDDKEVYKEKVHRFTPVYIPPKDQKPEREDEQAPKGKVKHAEADPESTDSDDSTTSKKRLGGLASMMSGKKVPQSKSQQLIQTRADEELKSYSTLSTLGRPLYTQVRRKKAYTGPSEKTEITEVKESKRIVTLHKGTTLDELAKKLSIKFSEMADKVLDINLLVKPEDYVGIKLASQIAALYDYRVEDRAFNEEEVIGKEVVTEEEISKYPIRNPIITIMGHVDHGKTTLLDYIRNTKVVDGEAGGITQHIGAYSVTAKDKVLTFLDTPGHAAFAAMRQRGADVTDIVVLIVAADDGVMPQTKESIRFCQQAKVPIIVAVNKIDKEGVNPDRIKQELSEFDIVPEEWGGDTQFVSISALKGQGVDDLLESIALQAEMLELRENPKGKAEGVIIESKVEQGRGPVVTLLVQTGTLKKGDSIVCGETYGRARSLMDHTGAQLKNAGPSTPVQILGLNDVPAPGDILNVVKNEREAKKIVSNRVDERKAMQVGAAKKTVSLEDFFATHMDGAEEQKVLNLIIRTDVQGSYEAIKQSLESMDNKEVAVKVVGGGVGAINDNDVNLATSAEAIIIGFNMRPISTARRLAEQNGIDVKTYSVIYELINDVKLALEGLLTPEFNEEFIGRAEVRETFSVPKVGTIAGSIVTDGKIQRGCNIRLLRAGKIVFDGKLSSLKRFKDDVKEVASGYECGIGLENFNDVKIEDVFEAYIMQEKKRTLEDVEQSQDVESKEAEESNQTV